VGPLQGTLLGAEAPAVDGSARPDRRALGATSWVSVTRGWLRGADTLLGVLAATDGWHQGRRRMYDRILDEPRLSRSFAPTDALPHPVMQEVRDVLSRRLGVPLSGVFLNYYRDGRDSVAWHGDRELRHLDDTRVAIVTLGAARPFLLRPHGGGAAHDLRPGSGDLIVMGGSCQRDWEHAVPKVARVGPRISLSMRWSSHRGTPTARASSRYGKRTASSSAASGSHERASSRHSPARSASMP
jgi:alkylated DNA repair dioxygenase AlkB